MPLPPQHLPFYGQLAAVRQPPPLYGPLLQEVCQAEDAKGGQAGWQEGRVGVLFGPLVPGLEGQAQGGQLQWDRQAGGAGHLEK